MGIRASANVRNNLGQMLKNIQKKYWKEIVFTIILLIIWALVFFAFFTIRPQESVIYYQGGSEESEFQVNEIHTVQLRIRSDQNNGRIFFGSDPDKLMYIVNQELLLNKTLEDLDDTSYWGQGVFPFDHGTATLETAAFLTLTIKMADIEALSYTLRVEHVSSDEGDNFVNKVTITDLPEQAVITLRSDSQISMVGNTTEDKMRAGEYRVLSCDSISFSLLPPPSENTPAGNWQACPMNVAARSFQIKNCERQMLEFTLNSQTEFREIGHITLSGDVEQDGSLIVDISDLSTYPLPVTLSGHVGRLEIADHSFYPTPKQWLRDNMTQILLALMGVIFSAIIIRPKSD